VEKIPCISERPFTEVPTPAEHEPENSSSPIDPMDPIAWNMVQPTYPSLQKTLFSNDFDFIILTGFATAIFKPPVLAI